MTNEPTSVLGHPDRQRLPEAVPRVEETKTQLDAHGVAGMTPFLSKFERFPPDAEAGPYERAERPPPLV